MQTTLTESERDLVSESLSYILSHKIQFFDRDDAHAASDECQAFLQMYPHKDERRETYFMTQRAYDRLVASGVIDETIRLRRKLG